LFIKLLTCTVLIKLLDPEPDPNPNQEQKIRIRIRFRLKRLGSSRIRIRDTGSKENNSSINSPAFIILVRQFTTFSPASVFVYWEVPLVMDFHYSWFFARLAIRKGENITATALKLVVALVSLHSHVS
jgi:hypothetical protein